LQMISFDFTGSVTAGYDLVGCDRCPDLIRIIVDLLALVDHLQILERTTLCIRRISAIARLCFAIVEDCLLGHPSI
jgi:hypothetical protein